jgi:hypothetical protein
LFLCVDVDGSARLPEMALYVQIIRERLEKAETIPEECYHTDAVMAQEWRGPN